jgi:UPF0271 protein
MSLKTIDINCDTGEGVGNEAVIMPLITRCNIACGGHAGDESSILQVINMAKDHQVQIGAHPSYPDKENFGRKVMAISYGELKKAIEHQLILFKECASRCSVTVTHIKPHGALYNEASANAATATTFVEAALRVFPNAAITAPFHSMLASVASAKGAELLFEAFGDRNYHDDLSLVSRNNPKALIKDPEQVLKHILHILENKSVLTVNNNSVPITANTICIHGDTPNAKEILKFINQRLPDHGWVVSL